jgi:DNA-binding transcriptional LysR family regulator
VSQPFVSQTITALEQRLGVHLLHRSTRGSRLTDEGERFLASCTEILDAIDQAEAQLLSDRGTTTGDLRVSAPLAFGMDQVVPRLPDFMAEYPHLTVHLSLSDSLANLIEDNIDVAVRMGQLRDSSLVSRKLCDLNRIVVASPEYCARHGEPSTPSDLAEHSCLLWDSPHAHLNRWPFLIDGAVQPVNVRGTLRSSDGLALFSLCVAGMGIMRCAEHLALPAIRSGRLVPLLGDYQAPSTTAIHAVFLPANRTIPKTRAFVDYLVDAFRNPPWLH